jgi:hypothetical protein
MWIVAFLALYGLTGYWLGLDIAILVTVGLWAGWVIVGDWKRWKLRRG